MESMNATKNNKKILYKGNPVQGKLLNTNSDLFF